MGLLEQEVKQLYHIMKMVQLKVNTTFKGVCDMLTLMELMEKLDTYKDGQRFKTDKTSTSFLNHGEAYLKAVGTNDLGLYWGTGFPISVTKSNAKVKFEPLPFEEYTPITFYQAMTRLQTNRTCHIKNDVDGESEYIELDKDSLFIDIDASSFGDIIDHVQYFAKSVKLEES